ncbi:hypothetical protein BB561_000674 [Smittium simulii]|uniref:HMA domain-containing protein n=1 Tax=Smittium simulii TaxID=133385 RepID=A0A2T9YY32_9FUNG|nr:hypothetical protein BB561_000674 [Smittium simulii]
MSCGGCSGAVKRALAKINVENVDIDMDSKIVSVTTDLPFDTIHQAIIKTGKQTEVVEA